MEFNLWSFVRLKGSLPNYGGNVVFKPHDVGIVIGYKPHKHTYQVAFDRDGSHYILSVPAGFLFEHNKPLPSVEDISESRVIYKTRRNPEQKSVEIHRAEMIDSYTLSIAECGGSASHFIKSIDTMTVKEMINALAQNGVRFTLDK